MTFLDALKLAGLLVVVIGLSMLAERITNGNDESRK